MLKKTMFTIGAAALLIGTGVAPARADTRVSATVAGFTPEETGFAFVVAPRR